MHIPTNWHEWLVQWDKQQERSRPYREEGIQVIVRLVESVITNGHGRVLDLACGCGSISTRLLAQIPNLTIVAVDRDPVLLQIARGLFTDNPQVSVVATDLYLADWDKVLGKRPFDAVVTATALHWLPAIDVQRIYRDISRLLRPGGIFVNFDWMPIVHAPSIGAIADQYVQRHEEYMAHAVPEIPSWDEWWETVANEPQLAEALARRQRLPERPAEFMAVEDWHMQALLAVGFSETAVVWRCFKSAVVAAVR